MRQHAGNCGMNLNSHYLMRAVNLLPTARQAAANFTSAAASGDPSQMQQVEEAAARAGSKSSSSSELAEAVAYSAAAAASGSIRVVLSVPDEAPPTDRNGKEWWPAGCQPTLVGSAAELTGTAGSSVSAGAGGEGHTSAAAAAAAGASSGGGVDVDAGNKAGVQHVRPTVGASDRAKLAALVESGAGSDRGIVREQDLFELLELPYLEPNQRNC
jgi:hypothetical protein